MTKGLKTYLITGATGRQGGAVARDLLARGWHVRALTRHPESAAARELAGLGAEIVKGDLDDRASLDRVLDGVRGVFGVQNVWDAGVEGEIRQGKTLIDAAKAAGVEHFIYSSVGGAERDTGIPHFESKWEIEEYLRASGLPATILRPVFFMGNFEMPDLRSAILRGKLPVALSPETPLQMIACRDIGAFAALAFERPKDFLGAAIELAGDELTMPETANAFSRVMGRPVRFQEVPIDEARSQSEDYAAMLEWFERAGYRADIPALRKLHPTLMTFQDWLLATQWERAAEPAGVRAGEESP